MRYGRQMKILTSLRIPLLALLMCCLLPPAVSALGRDDAAASNVFTSEFWGVAITKPDDWHFWSKEDWDYSRLMVHGLPPGQGDDLPLVTISKHAEPFEDLNCAIAIHAYPPGVLFDIDADTYLQLLVSDAPDNQQNYQVVRAPAGVFLSGHRAASARVMYDLRLADGTLIPSVEEVWIIPGRRFMYHISLAAKRDGSTGDIEEALAILDTIIVD